MPVEKVALITAGGSGMGADAARQLAADRFKVGILSSSGKGEALGVELGGFGVTGSNTSPDDLSALVQGAVERWGRVDALINSAGREQWLDLLGAQRAKDGHPVRTAICRRQSSLYELGVQPGTRDAEGALGAVDRLDARALANLPEHDRPGLDRVIREDMRADHVAERLHPLGCCTAVEPDLQWAEVQLVAGIALQRVAL